MELQTLKKAHYATAKIVEKLGSDYLVFFERICNELKKAEKRQDLKLYALKIANGSK